MLTSKLHYWFKSTLWKGSRNSIICDHLIGVMCRGRKSLTVSGVRGILPWNKHELSAHARAGTDEAALGCNQLLVPLLSMLTGSGSPEFQGSFPALSAVARDRLQDFLYAKCFATEQHPQSLACFYVPVVLFSANMAAIIYLSFMLSARSV